jgi:hypothetical protein
MKESDIEKEFGKYVKMRGGLYLKQNANLYPNIPDRLVAVPGARCFFLEWKMPGEEPKPGQLKWARMARSRGHVVSWCDDVHDGIELFERIMGSMGE